ncbi:MAG: hypothetical protein GX666_00180, partial [Tissierellia bacterium]|nr:hypothetical protein [Tissierellia bacterium]
MEEQKKSKKNKIHTILNIILSIIAVAGISYAYFAADIRNSETTSTIFGDAGEMVINYDGGPNIVVGQMTPSNDPFATKKFTVTGNSSITSTMYYNISIIKESNTFTDYGLAYNLTSTNTNNNGTIIPSSTKDLCYFLTGEGEEVLGNGTFTGPTNGNKVHTYTLKLYFPDEEYQIENQSKSFEFYISIREGEKTASECKQIPSIGDLILANNGGAENITEAPTSLFDSINTSDENKMYKMEDDYGDSYYFRGAQSYVNNNLIFAEHQWKIIRINGDGSLRIIYNGTCPGNSCTINTTGTGTHMMLPSDNSLYNSSGTSAYNLTNRDDNKYVGYMYGGANGEASTSRLQATTNETDTHIKSYLDEWYKINISGTNYENYISDTLFCNDREIDTSYGTGLGYAQNQTGYMARYRLYTNKTPSIKCNDQNDRFTTINYNNLSAPGNNKLDYPIGLLTADEGSLAGLKNGSSNSTNYLYTNQIFWTMSPYTFNSSDAYVWSVLSDGRLDYDGVNLARGVRGVLNLASNTPITGTGTTLDPYV